LQHGILERGHHMIFLYSSSVTLLFPHWFAMCSSSHYALVNKGV